MDNREERIRRKAHELWEQAGRPDHKSHDHWSEAERQIDKEGRESGNDTPPKEPAPSQGIDIGPSPEGDIHPVPAAGGGRPDAGRLR